MENEYKQKYIKYKTKYLERLNYLQQNGGGYEKKPKEAVKSKKDKKDNKKDFLDLTSFPAYSSSSEEIA